MIIQINYVAASWGSAGYMEVIQEYCQLNSSLIVLINSSFILSQLRDFGDSDLPSKISKPQLTTKTNIKSTVSFIVSSLGIYLFIHSFIKFIWFMLLLISQTNDFRCIFLRCTEQLLSLKKMSKPIKKTRLKKRTK